MSGLLNRMLVKAGLRSSFHERAFRTARAWSNRELARFAHLFGGEVVNVSAWEDRDKEGRFYRSYFTGASAYFITNFGTDQGVLQGTDNEVYLDLEQPLPPGLERRFDLVFNHTTLEHVYDFRTAFANMCRMTRDAVIIVVPWLQPLHSDYGDYWRFSPQAVARMFHDQGFTTLHIAWNDDARASVYVLAIAARDPARWRPHFGDGVDASSPDLLRLPPDFAGRAAF